MNISPIYEGRPENCGDRIPKEVAVYDLLDSLGIEYSRVDHDAADTIEACLEVEKVIGVGICKNLFVCNRQKTDYYMIMMSGEKPFRTADVSKKLGVSRLSFASSEDMERMLGVTPGSVTVMALKDDRDRRVQLVIDRDIINGEYIRCHPCINTSTLKMKTEDLLRVFLRHTKHTPRIIDI
ncbi:MAG: prolyl-tRNA synthetase associated domain-containing protein [Clostridia bacterium]|nr:prolyl-tRNA synthetase associated domain-containing protein [Oscillospiraceae bacterium]MBR6694734.1 prolyl-tRNA synthetase associated domain-containing protein [Clostridia bacterium]